MSRGGYVYILTNEYKRVLYVGITNDIVRRIHEHKEGIPGNFTTRYNVSRLVFAEYFDRIEDAIAAERYLKDGPRKRKVALIERDNPKWEEIDMGWAREVSGTMSGTPATQRDSPA